MKVLLDSCIWGGAAVDLRASGHDVILAGEWAEDPGDDEILARAANDARVLVTLDKDFGELAIVHDRPHAGIVSLVNLRAREQGPICCHVIEKYAGELARGAILTVEPGRVRIRMPDAAPPSEF